MKSKKSSMAILLANDAWCFSVHMMQLLVLHLLLADGMSLYGRDLVFKYSEWYDSAKSLMIDNLTDRKPIVRADMLRFALPNNETLEMMKVKKGTFFHAESGI